MQDLRQEVPRRVPVQVVPELGAGRELPALPERLELKERGGRVEEEVEIFSHLCFTVTFRKRGKNFNFLSLSLLASPRLFPIQNHHGCLRSRVDRSSVRRNKRDKLFAPELKIKKKQKT